jgi:hypothetical protein
VVVWEKWKVRKDCLHEAENAQFDEKSPLRFHKVWDSFGLKI